MSEQDLEAVARNQLPGADEKSIATLVAYAQASAKYLAAIESTVRRARFLAGKDGLAKVELIDVRNAIQEK